jgi:hypothetical protein
LYNVARWEQFNGVTSYLDGSMIYGSSLESAVRVRGGEEARADGKLATNRELPNFLPTRKECGKYCTLIRVVQK